MFSTNIFHLLLQTYLSISKKMAEKKACKFHIIANGVLISVSISIDLNFAKYYRRIWLLKIKRQNFTFVANEFVRKLRHQIALVSPPASLQFYIKVQRYRY